MAQIKKLPNAVLVKYLSYKDPDRRIVLERYADGTFAAFTEEYKGGQPINSTPIEDVQSLRSIRWDYGSIRGDSDSWHFHDFRKGDYTAKLNEGEYAEFMKHLKASS